MSASLYQHLPLILCIIVCFVGLAFILHVLTRPSNTHKRDTKPTRPIKSTKHTNPLLSALATVCLLIVLYLIFFAPGANWPLVVLFALVGLVFSAAARS